MIQTVIGRLFGYHDFIFAVADFVNQNVKSNITAVLFSCINFACKNLQIAS